MKKIVLTITSIIALSILLAGCATLFAPKTNPLAVSSEPQGAEVYVNGFKMGTTPVELSLKPDKSYTIEFRKEGYESVTRVVNTKVGAGWIVLDVLGGFIPVIIDAATGAWNKLDQDAVNAALIEQNK
ncbi:hypothetical protein MASR1M74_31220 [Lentimicrobium sp.]